MSSDLPILRSSDRGRLYKIAHGLMIWLMMRNGTNDLQLPFALVMLSPR
jgi:hypothetical protein